ncbi:MAG: hypothetical protein V7707_17610 [Motiliproteus sp.]
MKILVPWLMLTLGLVLSGCAHLTNDGETNKQQSHFDPLRSEIGSLVADDSRRKQMIKSVDLLEHYLDIYQATTAQYHQRLKTLYAEYDSERSEFGVAIENYETQRIDLKKALLKAHFELKAAAAVDEWSVLSEAEQTALNAFSEQFSGLEL